MDQAEKLRAIIKEQKQSNTSGARIITVTSGKGGVGKSNVSSNLALWFRRQGKRVVIFDADFGLANIEVMYGVIPKYTMADIMFKGKEIKDVITEGPEGVMFISGGSGIAKLVNLDNEQIKRLVNKLTELENVADVIIVDTGAGISPSVLEFVAASPEVVLVTTPEPTSITDSYALLKALAMYEGFDKENTSISLVANKVASIEQSSNVYEKLSSVVTKFLDLKINYLGAVPQDTAITKAVMKQKPVSIEYPSSGAAKAFHRICDRLMNKEVGTTQAKKGVSHFFGRILGMGKNK